MPRGNPANVLGSSFTNNPQIGLNLSSGKIPSCNLAYFENTIRLYFLCLETLLVARDALVKCQFNVKRKFWNISPVKGYDWWVSKKSS